jgi:hypothetical protein
MDIVPWVPARALQEHISMLNEPPEKAPALPSTGLKAKVVPQSVTAHGSLER